MAYTLSIDWFPVVGGILHIGTFIILQVITNMYCNQKNVWQLVFDPRYGEG